MQTISIIIMAAGDSTRFHYDATSINSCAPQIQTKKQWLRLGITPLWLVVMESLIQKVLPFCCNTALGNFLLESSDKQKQDKRINGSYTAKDIQILVQQYGDNPQSLEILIDILQKPFLSQVIVTASPKDRFYMQKLLPDTLPIAYSHSSAIFSIPMQIVEGGSSRYVSLQNALKQVDSDFVLVNDCARCNIQQTVLERLFCALLEDSYDCIAPYLPVNDTVLYAQNSDSQSYQHVSRESLRLIQTPQISKTSMLLESAKLKQDFSDETSAICALPNTRLGLVLGDTTMNKLTTKEDLSLLKPLYKMYATTQLLIGQGSDIHAFIDSKPLYLCGVQVESKQGLKAHSDGDVGIHAIIDSLLGAMNCGDIGEIFPDTDSAFKDIDSKILLQRIYDYCLSTGLEISNLDITIIAQTPRISPYKTQMQETLSQILYLPKSRISIKASTAEKLGFIGRQEGIFAQCVAALQPRIYPNI
ncbi:2-C-methyl-D-erythritol 2,4-cyclodiphosphate synthase [Helicobacter aurati]|uniref:Bifunctional enzyme IspD/IspF n=1 Tax=Helicobacter aurati TaxID=137778 RepID=A0A3D8J7U6_9HELI|nr:2-C-methyl-D-erythritol 2,4-cyclodiphosphate synthase [Helicobacter aurati]